ncbi:MAG: DUF86 domain-containing protein [Planctomycetota bacterium]
MKRNIALYIKDMLENMSDAEQFIGQMTYRQFARDKKTNFAVARSIEIIGEAAKHIPAEIRKKYSEIPWKDIAGMRDKVIHFYFGINLERVWTVVKKDIPDLRPRIKEVLKGLQAKK